MNHPGLTITEEPVMSIHLLNEIRKVCEGCGLVGSCANAKSVGALAHCQKVKDNESAMRQKVGCQSCQ